MLQQCLPFTVLKHYKLEQLHTKLLSCNSAYRLRYWNTFYKEGSFIDYVVATVLTVYGIETFTVSLRWFKITLSLATVLTVYGVETTHRQRFRMWPTVSCNSTYRLRYAQKGARQQRSRATMRSAHIKYLNEVKVKQRWWGNSLTVYGIETFLHRY